MGGGLAEREDEDCRVGLQRAEAQSALPNHLRNEVSEGADLLSSNVYWINDPECPSSSSSRVVARPSFPSKKSLMDTRMAASRRTSAPIPADSAEALPGRTLQSYSFNSSQNLEQ